MANTFNEETVKNRYLIPYLQRLGFNSSELSFEDHFSIRLGRNVVELKGKRNVVNGYLDILVKRGNQNLLVVEAKRQGTELTLDDRDQGISYASLVRPIAPYVLVTNGDDFQLFDTLTKEEISGTAVSPDSDFEISLPREFIEEAARYFLGLSTENLCAFSKSQVDNELRPLLGSKAKPLRKFIPELFVAGASFNQALRDFLGGSRPLFALIADSGRGKTCHLCDLVRERVDRQQPVLFYRGINLSGSILESVVSDFGWTFAESLTAVELVRRLENITSENELLIVIDGIDEWEYEHRRQDLLNTVQRLATTRHIKLLVSCKATVWKQFLDARGQPTGIEEYLYRKTDEVDGFLLQPMSKKEFAKALEKYKAFYGVGRAWEDVALDAAKKNPFFMRVLFEVAQNEGDEFIVLDSTKPFMSYLNQSISRLKHPEAARVLLISLARLLFAEGNDRLPHADFILNAGAAYSESVLQELVEYQILEWAATDSGMQISFYFSQLRDYIVTFQANRWQEAHESRFKESLEGLRADSPVHQEALAFFYRYAEEDKRRLIDSVARSRAEDILKTYRSLISTELAPLRDRFIPFTNGPIGYVGTFDPSTNSLGFSFLRELGESDEQILLLPALGKNLHDSNLPYLYGAKKAIGAARIVGNQPDATDYAVNWAIGRQLREIVDKGNLRESSVPKMAQEHLIGIISRTGCGYGGEPHPARLRNRPPKFPRQKPSIFPLRTKDVRHWLKYWSLYQYFRRERVNEKIGRREIAVTEHDNGFISYPEDLSCQDLKEIDAQIEAHLEFDEAKIRHIIGPTQDGRLRGIEGRVKETLETLDSFGIDALEDELFPEIEILNRAGLNPARGGIEEEAFYGFLEKLFSAAFDSFVSIAKENFGELHTHFPLIRCQPIVAVLAVSFSERKRVRMYLCQGEEAGLRVVAKPISEVRTSYSRDPWKVVVETDGKSWERLDSCSELTTQRTIDLDRLFYSRKYLDLESASPSSMYGRAIPAVLRTLVYDQMRLEVATVFSEICRKYGTKIDTDEWKRFARPML